MPKPTPIKILSASGTRQSVREVTEEMSKTEAYWLGYNQGYAKGCKKGREDYRRALDLLKEERALVEKLRARCGL